MFHKYKKQVTKAQLSIKCYQDMSSFGWLIIHVSSCGVFLPFLQEGNKVTGVLTAIKAKIEGTIKKKPEHCDHFNNRTVHKLLLYLL